MARYGGDLRTAAAATAAAPCRRYTAADIRVLADVDETYRQMSGLAAREGLRRQFEVLGEPTCRASRDDLRRPCLQPAPRRGISCNAHRVEQDATNHGGHRLACGARARRPAGPHPRRHRARVDFVHVGDRAGVKGTLSDQRGRRDHPSPELVGATTGISERFLRPLLEGLLRSFPFRILGFHVDNGSECINHRVAELLAELRVERFTKPGAPTSNDNAMVEGKKVHVMRRWFGHDHIPHALRR